MSSPVAVGVAASSLELASSTFFVSTTCGESSGEVVLSSGIGTSGISSGSVSSSGRNDPASIETYMCSRARPSCTATTRARMIVRWMAIEIANGPPAKCATLRIPAGIDAAAGKPRILLHANARIRIELDTARQAIRIAIMASSLAPRPSSGRASPETKIGGGRVFLRFILRGTSDSRARTIVVQPAAESRDLRLPLVAEREDQHLLVDVRVLGQRLHRAATRRREHLVRRLRLPIERGQR